MPWKNEGEWVGWEVLRFFDGEEVHGMVTKCVAVAGAAAAQD